MTKKIIIIKAKKLISAITASGLLLASTQAALAQTNVVPTTIQPIDNIINVVRGIIQFILVVAFVLAFILLLIGGIRWITAGGDEKGVASARNTITAALIGLVVVLVAYALLRLVEIFFQVQIISNGVTIPTINTPS